MNTKENKESTENKELAKATEHIPAFLLPLSKDQQKVDNLFNNNMLKALTLLKGKSFSPTAKIPSESIEAVMDDLFKEDTQILIKEVKEGMRSLLKKKVAFDKVVKQKTLEFQSSIIEQKKNLNADFDAVMSKIEGIEQMKNAYLESFKAIEVDKKD